MDLYIQMGHGMQGLSEDLIKQWSEGTLILSPQNIPSDRISGFCSRIQKAKGNVLIDPQIYYPRKKHKKLTCYDYWPKEDLTLLESGGFTDVMKELIRLNQSANTSALILPSLIANSIDDIWDKLQQSIIQCSKTFVSDVKRVHTVALSGQVVVDEVQMEKIISYVSRWDVEGLYIVCEHPTNHYLVDNAVWIANLLALVTGLKRLGKKVIVGYCNQQMLCLANAKCDAIASGNFRNVRWFQSAKFEPNDDSGPSRRATWYYSPQALSEFKVTFLDIAKGMSLLETMRSTGRMTNPYSEMLFGEAAPSSTGYNETSSFKHYLWCLREQCHALTRSSYKETKDAQTALLNTADQVLSALHDKQIKGQDRDFYDFIDVNQAALALHDEAYGLSLSHEWKSL